MLNRDRILSAKTSAAESLKTNKTLVNTIYTAAWGDSCIKISATNVPCSTFEIKENGSSIHLRL